jgi:Ribonuclease G/E
VKSSATICHEILIELKKVAREVSGAGVVVRVNPDIAAALQGEERDVLRAVERAVGRAVVIRADALLHHEQFDVMVM